MTIYRLYIGLKVGNLTEENKPTDVIDYINDENNFYKLPGFTFYQGVGYFEGIKEPSLIVEVIADDDNRTKQSLLSLAGDITVNFNQKSVLFTEQSIETRLVS